MKLKLSHRDFILLIGIVVAIVVALTTWKYHDRQPKTHLVQPGVDRKTRDSATSMVMQKIPFVNGACGRDQER